jgi:hypothetical protein
MKMIASIKRTFLYSLVLLVAAFGLLFTAPSALAASTNLESTQYLISDTTAPAAPADSEIGAIDEAISSLRSAKLAISKLLDLPLDVRKAILNGINAQINELIQQKKALSAAA